MSEDQLRRKPPYAPYRAGESVLHVPDRTVDATLKMLRRFGKLETCVFWFGERSQTGGTVRAVVAPRQVTTSGNYQVVADAMVEMADALPDASWKPLAQVHSHPGPGVEHSRYDDEMASSKRALSLVFPLYGHWSEPWPKGVGIHEHQDGYWHLLEATHAANRARLIPGEVFTRDLRE